MHGKLWEFGGNLREIIRPRTSLVIIWFQTPMHQQQEFVRWLESHNSWDFITKDNNNNTNNNTYYVFQGRLVEPNQLNRADRESD